MQDDRVYVVLKQDESGYPPWDEEWIWAQPVGPHLFRLDASPTFVRGLSYRDIVHAVPVGDRWYADSVEEDGGHSTIRMILFDGAHHDHLLALGRRFGIDVDHTELPRLFAIDVPPTVDYAPIRAELLRGFAEGAWDIDEGNLGFTHQTDAPVER